MFTPPSNSPLTMVESERLLSEASVRGERVYVKRPGFVGKILAARSDTCTISAIITSGGNNF